MSPTLRAASIIIRKYDSSGALLTPPGTTTYYLSNSIVASAAVNPAGTELILPINANTNQILSFSTADGSLVSKTPVVAPTSVVALPDGQFAVTSLTSKRLVQVIDARARFCAASEISAKSRNSPSRTRSFLHPKSNL